MINPKANNSHTIQGVIIINMQAMCINHEATISEEEEKLSRRLEAGRWVATRRWMAKQGVG
jgi:hypothetical protein